MKRDRGLWLSSGLLFLLLFAVFLVWWSWANKEPSDPETFRDMAATVASTSEKAGSSPQEGTARNRKFVRETSPPEKPGRSYGTLQREAKRIFGEAEAARSTKLGERFADGIGSYLYKVEAPTRGEAETVRAQIADLRDEATEADREKLDKHIEWLVDSYDPYGVDGAKIFLIQVPVSDTEKMHAYQIVSGDVDSLQAEFMKGGLTRFSTKQGWLASNPGETLDRFDHLMIWKPEKD